MMRPFFIGLVMRRFIAQCLLGDGKPVRFIAAFALKQGNPRIGTFQLAGQRGDITALKLHRLQQILYLLILMRQHRFYLYEAFFVLHGRVLAHSAPACQKNRLLPSLRPVFRGSNSV